MSEHESIRKAEPTPDFELNDARLKAFVRGKLTSIEEDQVASLLERRPTLIEKLSATIGDPFVKRLHGVRARQQKKAILSSATTMEPTDVDATFKNDGYAKPLGLPTELSSSLNVCLAILTSRVFTHDYPPAKAG